MSVKDEIGEEHWNRCREVLRKCFADENAVITDQMVDAFAHGLAQRMGDRCPFPAPSAADDVGAAAAALVAPSTAGDDPAVRGYYLGAAEHSRVGRIAPFSAFVEKLPVVRVTLQQTDKRPYQTAIGEVLSGDHLLYSMDDVAAKYGSKFGGTLTRLDLITPARGGPPLLEARFGAIAVFMGYVDGADQPAFSVLEAGMATGQAMVTYWGGEIGETVVHQSGYKPTDFSRPWYWYHGRFTTCPGEPDEPEQLTVLSTKQENDEERIQVTVTYEKQATPVGIWPALLTADAAMRIAAIGKAAGQPTTVPLEDLMATLGRELLDWLAPADWAS